MNKEFQAFKSATEMFAQDVAQDYYKSVVELLLLVSRGKELDYSNVMAAAEKMAESKKELVSLKKSQAFVEKEYYLQTFADIYVDAAVEAIVTGALAMAQAFVEKVGNEIRKLH
jgi:hypothetical protein